MVRNYQDMYISKKKLGKKILNNKKNYYICIMKAKKVQESLKDFLKPKGISDIINSLRNLSVDKKIKEISRMQREFKGLYSNLLKNETILNDIRDQVKKELNNFSIIEKVDYIEKIEKKLPEIFTNMKDEKLLKELKEFILKQDFVKKGELVWRFFKSWPDLFKDVEEDPRIDPETNQLMLLFRIKGAINNHEVDNIENLIQEMGQKWGRENVLDNAERIKISTERYGDHDLFNKKEIEQLKLSLYKETRTEEELTRDELFDIYVFIAYNDFIKKEIYGEILHKKTLGIENLVKVNKYDASSLAQVGPMKIRARVQYPKGGEVFAVYIPKYTWNKDYTYNDDIPDDLRKFIDENKFKI